jgi:DNA repair protein RadC
MALSVATALPAKRVDFVSVRLVKEGSTKYPQRFINNPQDAARLAEEFIADSDREQVIAICLDVKHQPTSIAIISVGTVNSSLVHPREVLKQAILSNASAIILAHNHPSGDLTPSKPDIDMTKRLSEATEIMGIDLLDHIIVGDGRRYISFREQGLM